jgi:hypothetical protein
MTRECMCVKEKTYQLIFDGGNSGFYTVDFCDDCYFQEDKKFVKTEVKLV